MTVITTIDDFKHPYRRRVPKMFYDYVESGSWTEQTFRDNSNAFAAIRLRQRVGIDVSGRSTDATLLGEPAAMPLALAPVGMLGLQHADGEIEAARAAERFGVPFTLSTMSINSIEEVAAATARPFWFQLYLLRDQGFVEDLIRRAEAAACPALVLTLDLPVIGQRHQDLKNHISLPSQWSLATLLNVAAKWSWGRGLVPHRRRQFGNIVGYVQEVTDHASLLAWLGRQFDSALDWDKVRRVRERWGGKLVLKGILDPQDARIACDLGADAIVVSNHGGRQLDGAPSTIEALPAVVAAVGDDIEVQLDSGIRSGQDIFKALALGARGVQIGRAYVYGLGAWGGHGVTRVLEILHKELDLTMALCGVDRIAEPSPANLLLPRDFAAYR